MAKLAAPFAIDDALVTPTDAFLVAPGGPSQSNAAASNSPKIPFTLPAIFESVEGQQRSIIPVAASLSSYFNHELDVSRLNRFHKHLWLAGLPQRPRSLQRQLEVGRQVRLTARADMHLLWHNTAVYLKPLPDFLLSNEVWATQLCSPSLHASALGFLQSYLWLIMSPTDHRLAIDNGLINDSVSWEKWTAFVAALVRADILAAPINPRYRFGELRLGRIDWIHRLCSTDDPGRRRWRGYVSQHYSYADFIESNLRWLLTLFLYVTIVLSAMQVGIGTQHLGQSRAFQGAAWVFSVICIVLPLVVVGAVLSLMTYLVFANWAFASGLKLSRTDPLWDDEAIREWKH